MIYKVIADISHIATKEVNEFLDKNPKWEIIDCKISSCVSTHENYVYLVFILKKN